MSTSVRMIRFDRSSAWTRPANNSSGRHGHRWMRRRAGLDAWITSTSAKGWRTSSCSSSRFVRGWRRVWITPQRRKGRVGRGGVKQLLDEHYPQAERLVLVCDNLNTHTGGALYEAFPAAESRRLWERLEIHSTLKHGSWLNMAETELSVLSGQCLDRRIDEVAFLRSEVGSWEDYRNGTEAKVRWRFTTEDARIKLEKLYPVFEYPDPHGLQLPANLSKLE